MKGKLYLIPTPITEGEQGLATIPAYNIEILKRLEYFIVENTRSARRFISSTKQGIVIDTLTIVEYNEHSSSSSATELLKPLLKGLDCGLMSEAGLPAIADPGEEIVAAAHNLGIEVIPLSGPSSILLALMASGLNGEGFAFNGYLPIKPNDREKRIQQLVQLVKKSNQSQIFIETPYRNKQLFDSLIKNIPSDMALTVAADVTSNSQYIKTKKVLEWKRERIDDILKKVPTIFIIGNFL